MKLATLCYIKKDNQTLMLHRNKKENDYHEGKWNGLGGKFEQGESPEQCMRREIFEESGLTVQSATLRGFITFPMFDGSDDWYVFVYTIESFTGELIDSPEGELHWINNDKILDLNLWDGDKIFIQWIDQPKTFSAIFYYDSHGNFQNHEVTFY